MSEEFDREEETVLETVDAVARGGEAPAATPLEREVVELLALLPYELEPVAPRPELWETIRERVATSPAAGTSVVPFPERAVSESQASPSSVRALRRGMLAMAAVLALCLVGLGYLLVRTQGQQSSIVELTHALEASNARLAEATRAHQQLDMITRVARQVYPMRPAVPAPEPRRTVSGKVFVCAKHQQWYLNIQGLEPAPPGYEYCLWFETEEGKVPGGAVVVRDGVAELSARSMPEGTRGFAVTLEVEDSHPAKPRGDVLLLSEEGVSL